MNKSALLLIFIFFTITGCRNETTINEDEASDVISRYLETNPEYKTATFNFGEVKFRGKSAKEELNNYRKLEGKDYISMELREQKKAFLAKDSSFTYLITLTEKAAPYVLRQDNDKATVKVINYVLDDAKPVNFVKTTDKTAKATVSLKKVETDFYPFQKKGSNAEFITKTYKLKLKKDVGWAVAGE